MIIDLDENRPCLLIDVGDNSYHIIPRVVFERLISGDLKPSDVDDFDKILPVILKEWLDGH